MFAYCNNNPVGFSDKTGTFLQNTIRHKNGLCEYTDAATGTPTLYAPSGATITIRETSIEITANMMFDGPLDEESLIAGIKTYWEGDYIYNSKQYSVSVTINTCDKATTNTIIVYTDQGNGTSYTQPCWFVYSEKNNSITLYEHYELGAPKNVPWVMAHEFGHALGIGDFNGFVPSDAGVQYIMNDIGAHANNYELAMVVAAFQTGEYQIWR